MSFCVMDRPQRFCVCFPCGYIDTCCFTFSYMVFLLVYEPHVIITIMADYGITCTTNNSVYRTLPKILTMDNDKVCRVTRDKRITVNGNNFIEMYEK